MNNLTAVSKIRQHEWSKILLTIIGTFIMAVAVNLVYEPMNIVPGGVSGLSIVIKKVTEGIVEGGIPVWITTAVINVPLFVLAWHVKGKDFIARTLIATVSFTIALAVIPSYGIIANDYILATLFGGVLTGAGLGLVFYTGGSTGGTDLLGAIFNFYFPQYSVGQFLRVIDSCVILLGATIFGINSALYAIITTFVVTKIMDSILEGVKFAKLAYIISDKHDELSDMVLNQMDRGATLIEAEGCYTKKEKRMLMCVVSNKQVVRLKELVSEIDEEAFIIITDAREVMGRGFVEN